MVFSSASTAIGTLLDDAAAKGAKIIAGGKGESVVMPATVVDGVTDAMNLYRDESFGPVVAMIRARDAEHAVELANDTQYGLTNYVQTGDPARANRLSRQLRSGMVEMNAVLVFAICAVGIFSINPPAVFRVISASVLVLRASCRLPLASGPISRRALEAASRTFHWALPRS